jgi:hypothetical protein
MRLSRIVLMRGTLFMFDLYLMSPNGVNKNGNKKQLIHSTA